MMILKRIHVRRLAASHKNQAGDSYVGCHAVSAARNVDAYRTRRHLGPGSGGLGGTMVGELCVKCIYSHWCI